MGRPRILEPEKAKKEELHRVIINLPDGMWQAAVEWGKPRGLTVSGAVRVIFADFLERERSK